jgi:flagellar protein FliS
MLLDGAVRFSKIARQSILDNDVKKAHENIIKTQDIFYELIASLDVNKGGEWAKNLIEIYDFIIRKLIESNIKKDAGIMDEIIPLIEDVRDTWNEAYKAAKSYK